MTDAQVGFSQQTTTGLMISFADDLNPTPDYEAGKVVLLEQYPDFSLLFEEMEREALSAVEDELPLVCGSRYRDIEVRIADRRYVRVLTKWYRIT